MTDKGSTTGTGNPPAPPTDLLYQRDAYLASFDATVTSVDPTTGSVTVDRSVFYPAGGGQPADGGTLTRLADGATWQVVNVRKDGAAVRLTLDPSDRLPQPGDAVRGELDWPIRYRLMRTHTALHVLCGVVFRDYGALVTGGNMGPDKARMDFELEDLSPDRVAEIERRANEEIAAGRDVRVRILPREEAFQIPDLIRTKINLLPQGITEVRTVEIVGLDLQADGGTHVANTREVGGIKVVGTRSKGKSNKRLEIVLTGGEGDEQFIDQAAPA
ncbi:MAG TPA: alanyl-tRNA editing protein [Thermomicrobiales bacterium]|jgi:misacylated tRNA(Ala) deacylase